MPVYTLARLVVPPVIRFWVRLDCEGLLHVPQQGPVIIAANHLSYFDPLCLGTFVDAAGRQARFLTKSELFERPLLGWVLRAAGQIPVHRESQDASRALVDAVAAMREGAAVVIYPEGTTTKNPDYSPMRPKSGVARLAALTGAPVVPVGIWGAQLLFARGHIGPFRRGIRVVLRAGPPLHLGLTPDASLEELNVARDRVMEAIVKLEDEAKEGWSPPDWYLKRQRAAPPA
jgi:1-acyl-sn-glycerol-3-phosphate acyltransferase